MTDKPNTGKAFELALLALAASKEVCIKALALAENVARLKEKGPSQ